MLTKALPVVAAIILAVIVATTGVAGAHSELALAAPEIGSKVGGTIDRIEMTFFGGITEAAVFVETPSGLSIPARIEDSATNVIWAALERPLDEPGQHIVRYQVTSNDGDAADAAYAFVYEPTEPAPIYAGGAAEDGGGSSRYGVIGVAIALGLVYLLFIAYRRRETAAS